MKDMGIKEIARQVGEIAETMLVGREGCATVINNEIVLRVKNESAYIETGVRFDVDTPRMLLLVAINIINRMIFDLGPEAASAIVTSTHLPKVKCSSEENNSSWHAKPRGNNSSMHTVKGKHLDVLNIAS
jgi:hypothetical protein